MNLRHAISMLFALGILWIAQVGCSRVATRADGLDGLPQLPLARMADETVVVEVALVQVPQSSTWDEKVWSEIDEQHLPLDARHRMTSNGFRAGIVGMQLPEGLRQQLDARQSSGARGVLAELSPGEDHVAGARRIQLRDGNRSDIVTRSSQESLVVLMDDGEGVVGRTFKEAQPTFTLRAFRMADGRARLELTPEMRFGPTRQRWASGEGAFRMESGRDRRTFDELTIDTVLSAGQTLVVAAAGPARSLGGSFFASKVDGQREKALLIRLSETGYSDFYPDDFATDVAESRTGADDTSGSPVVQVIESDSQQFSGAGGMSLTTELD